MSTYICCCYWGLYIYVFICLNSGEPTHHWTLSNGPRFIDPDLTIDEFCQSLNPTASEYNVVGSSFTLIPAPAILNYSCSVSTENGAYIDLGEFPNSCVSNPALCLNGHSTWSIWLKIHHNENSGISRFVSSGSVNTPGVFLFGTSPSECVFGATASLVTWIAYITIPDGSWFHLVILLDTIDNKCSMFIDGIPIYVNLNPVSNLTERADSDISLTLGTTSGAKGTENANAAYSDLMIFEKLLTEDEIKEIHDGALGKY